MFKAISIFILIAQFSFAQNKTIDSLTYVLKNSLLDTIYVNNQNLLSKLYYTIKDYKKAYEVALAAKKNSKKIKFRKGIAASYEMMGVINQTQNSLDDAFKNFILALKEREAIKDKVGISNNYHSIGTVFYFQGNIDKAIQYFLIDLKIRKEIGNIEGMADTYNGIGVCYNIKREYKTALNFHTQGLELKLKLKNNNNTAISYSGIGNVYGQMENFEMALKSHLSALKLCDSVKDISLLITLYINIGRDYIALKRYHLALQYLNRALAISRKNNDVEHIISIYGNLSGLYQQKKEIENAYKYLTLYHEGMDSIQKANLHLQISEMSVKYETEKKDEEIKFLNREKKLKEAELLQKSINQRTLFFSSISVVVFIGLLTFLFFQNYKQKQRFAYYKLEHEKTISDLSFLKAQVNPHMLFNTINTIYIQLDENVEGVRENLIKFANVMRYQLYDCNETFVDLKQEIIHICNYIDLQKLRKSSELKILINIDQNIDEILIAPLLFIPLIENAFKYASSFKDRENYISIDLHLHSNKLYFKCENTFFKKTDAKNKNFKYGGIGLVNLKRRLELIYPHKHNLTIREDDWVFYTELILDAK